MLSAAAAGSSTPAPPNFNLERYSLAPISPVLFLKKPVLNVMNSDGHGTKLSDLENKTSPSYLDDASTTHDGSSVTPHPVSKGFVVGEPTNGHVKEEVVSQPKRAAMIHDFCLGIPFGEYLSA
ncbi:UNVERIFIED_CONTAM: hypothetical protein Slati_3026500 [Sesamum latifolium]|uniref:Uncharacterized protein n=1 Tax=Sesamum latifolium TaxID=2727402 RepID=A0AAW2VGC2_9LAMI